MSVESRQQRRSFMRGLHSGIRVVWPILSALLALIAGLGLLVGWNLQESAYFSFATGLTIGYGDFAPKTLIGRVLSVCIGLCGLLMTALLAAIAVKALGTARSDTDA